MKKIEYYISKIFSSIADCIVPTLPVLIGAGMLKVLLIIIGPTTTNLISADSPTYKVLTFVADAGYYFMPIFVAISSAEVFKTNKFIAGFVGGMLLAPAFIEYVNTNTSLSFFGLPISLTNYGSQVLPSIIAIWIMSYVYSFLDSHIGENFKALLLPLLTIVIMIPVAFSVIGPLGVFLGNQLVKFILALKDIGPLGNAIVCALLPFVVIGGLGGADVSAMILLANTGMDPILFFANVIYNNVVGFVTLALYIRDKKSSTLALAITSSVAGTSEPALFSLVMKDLKALMATCIGCFVGGLYAGITGVKTFAMASFGIFGLAATIGPSSSIIHGTIAVILGCAVGFIITLLTHKENE